jgi:F-type H+-transporting ATPase subunit epsilon
MARSRTIHVSVVSAEEEIFDGVAEFVALPGEAASSGSIPAHAADDADPARAPCASSWPGTQRRRAGVRRRRHLEVQPDEVTVLAETAIRGRDLDEARANEAKKQAEESLAQQHRRRSITPRRSRNWPWPLRSCTRSRACATEGRVGTRAHADANSGRTP